MEYNYVAQEDDELTLKKGDIITGIKVMLGGWWEGTLRDKRGMFPDNFVKVLHVEWRFYHFYVCLSILMENIQRRYWTLPQLVMEPAVAVARL